MSLHRLKPRPNVELGTNWVIYVNDKFDVCLSLATLNIKVCWIAKQVLQVRLRSIFADKHANKEFLLSGPGGCSPMYVCAAPKDLCAVLV